MFYTYLWLREDGTVYYVGKGKDNRAFYTSSHKIQCPKDRDRIIIQFFESEGDALLAEKVLISFFGRLDNNSGCLRNLTDGGENPPIGSHRGHCHSNETKLKLKNYFTKNLSEKRFGKLIAIRQIETNNKHASWECKCDCGNICTKLGTNLLTGNTKSCGCIKKGAKIC